MFCANFRWILTLLIPVAVLYAEAETKPPESVVEVEKEIISTTTSESKPIPETPKTTATLSASGLPMIPGITAPALQSILPVAPEDKRLPAESDRCLASPMKVASLVIPPPSAEKVTLSSGTPRRLVSYNLNLPCPATVTITAQLDYQLVHCWNEYVGAVGTSRACKGSGSNGSVQVRNQAYTVLGFAQKDRQLQEGYLNGLLREASTKIFVNVSNSTDTFPGLTHSYSGQQFVPVTLSHSASLKPGDYQIALDVHPDGLGDGNTIERLHPMQVLIVPD